MRHQQWFWTRVANRYMVWCSDWHTDQFEVMTASEFHEIEDFANTIGKRIGFYFHEYVDP